MYKEWNPISTLAGIDFGKRAVTGWRGTWAVPTNPTNYSAGILKDN